MTCFVTFLVVALSDPIYRLDGNELIIAGSGSVSDKWKETIPALNVHRATINDGITELLTNAFSNCNNLEEVSLPETITSIAKCFDYTSLRYLSIPRSLISLTIESSFYQTKTVEYVSVSPSNSKFCSYNKCLYDKNKTQLLYVPSALKTLEIWNQTLSVGKHCFQTNIIKEIFFPDSIQSLSSMTFFDCRELLYLNFSANSNLTSLQSSVFHGSCPSLFICPPKVTEIMSSAFGWSMIKKFTYHPGSNLTRVNSLAFTNAGSLEVIELPSSISYIASDSFQNAPKLSKITIAPGCEHFTTINGSIYDIYQSTLYFVPSSTKFLCIPENTSQISVSILQGIRSLTDAEVHPKNNFLIYDNGTFYSKESMIAISSIGGLIYSVILDSCTKISNACFAYNKLLKSVVFSDKSLCTDFLSNTFRSCTSLEDIRLPPKLKEIPLWCFYGTALSYVFVPKNVTIVQDRGFGEISRPIDIEFEEDSKLQTLITYSFIYTKISSINLPNSLKYIQSESFYKSEIKTVKIPSGVIELGNSAFKNCAKLSSIEFDPLCNLRSIGDYAFDGDVKLYSVTFSPLLRVISSYSFANCKNLCIINFGTSAAIETIEDSAFTNCTSLTSFSILPSITTVAPGAFTGCTYLTKFITPQGSNEYESAGGLLFRKATTALVIFPPGLEKGSVSSSTTEIEDRAFYGHKVLKKLEFESPSQLTAIGKSTFFGCSSLEKLILPSKISKLNDGCFEGCTALTSLIIGAESELTQIAASTFKGCTNLSEFEIEGESRLETIGSFAFSSTRIKSIKLPSTLSLLGDGAFAECASLSEIIFQDPDKFILKALPVNCFSGCSIASTELPSSIGEVGKECFSRCESLENITIHSDDIKIGSGAFSGCRRLKFVYFCGNKECTLIGSLSAFDQSQELFAVTLDSYKGNSFCGIAHLPVMEHCMVLPTMWFSVHSPLSTSGSAFAVTAIIGDSDDRVNKEYN